MSLLPSTGMFGGLLLGGGLALAFGFTPMLRDKVWADRPWSVVLVDAGYAIVARALAGALLAGCRFEDELAEWARALRERGGE